MRRVCVLGVPVCNPYLFFGQYHAWPRGYPLDYIKGPACTSFARQDAHPMILQARMPDIQVQYMSDLHRESIQGNIQSDINGLPAPLCENIK